MPRETATRWRRDVRGAVLAALSTGSDPLDAHEIWSGVSGGSLRIVAQFDHGGRRYLVIAKAARSPACATASLTPRESETVALAAEGLPNKQIAYALGLQTATVSRYLFDAAVKLGALSRSSLLRLYAERLA